MKTLEELIVDIDSMASCCALKDTSVEYELREIRRTLIEIGKAVVTVLYESSRVGLRTCAECNEPIPAQEPYLLAHCGDAIHYNCQSGHANHCKKGLPI